MKLAILDDYQNVAHEFADWASLGVDITTFHDTLADDDAVIARLAPFDILCLMRERTPLTPARLSRLPNLKLIVTSGKRNDSIDVAAANARGIPVCGTDGPAHSTPELTMALILAAARNITDHAASMRDGGWQKTVGRDLHGATLGLIGLGRLGAVVAGLAKAFGMHIIAWSENLTSQRCAEIGAAHAASLNDLLARADFASIHLRLSDRTRGLIGAAQLACMKPDGVLINTSRGPIIEWRALIAALEAGRPGQAAIDVYDEEPLPTDHPLRQCKNLLPMPHIGYVTRQTYEVFYRQTVEDVAAWLKGAPIRIIEP